MTAPPTAPALIYFAWMRTLWRMDQRHDFHGRPRAANED